MGVIPFGVFPFGVGVFYMGVKVFLYDPPPYYIIERAKREDASFTSRCAADTMPQSILLFGGGISGPFALLFLIHGGKEYMKRTWDESNSPQWRYFLARESEIKHRRISHQNRDDNDDAIIEEAENLFRTPDGEIKRNRPGKKVRRQQQQKRRENNPKGESPQKFTKKGREILYSASPGRPLSLPHGGIKKND